MSLFVGSSVPTPPKNQPTMQQFELESQNYCVDTAASLRQIQIDIAKILTQGRLSTADRATLQAHMNKLDNLDTSATRILCQADSIFRQMSTENAA